MTSTKSPLKSLRSKLNFHILIFLLHYYIFSSSCTRSNCNLPELIDLTPRIVCSNSSKAKKRVQVVVAPKNSPETKLLDAAATHSFLPWLIKITGIDLARSNTFIFHKFVPLSADNRTTKLKIETPPYLVKNIFVHRILNFIV